MTMFDQIKADYIRHDRSIKNPALWAILNYRFGRWANKISLPVLRWIFSKIYGLNFFIIMITSGLRLYRETIIGTDFHIIHAGNILIHPKTIIGDRCGIMHDVTIGTNMGAGTPVIGNDVFIGVGAKVLGAIKIGNGVLIAANSLVVSDVPDNATVIGVPAKIVKIEKESI